MGEQAGRGGMVGSLEHEASGEYGGRDVTDERLEHTVLGDYAGYDGMCEYAELGATVNLTRHGQARACRQNLMSEDLRYVLAYGSQYHGAGACFCSLRTKDIPMEDRRYSAIHRLIGTTLVLSADDHSAVITCYREARGGLVSLRKKCRYDRKVAMRQERRESQRMRERLEASVRGSASDDGVAMACQRNQRIALFDSVGSDVNDDAAATEVAA